jgi:hypothetical protein
MDKILTINKIQKRVSLVFFEYEDRSQKDSLVSKSSM